MEFYLPVRFIEPLKEPNGEREEDKNRKEFTTCQKRLERQLNSIRNLQTHMATYKGEFVVSLLNMIVHYVRGTLLYTQKDM